MSEVQLLPLTIKATADITKHRMVKASGVHTGAGETAFGVARTSVDNGERFTADTYGVINVETGAAVTEFGLLESDASGRAVNRVAGSTVGVALKAATAAGQLIPVFFYPGTPINVVQPQIKLTAGTGGVTEGRAVTAAGVHATAGGTGNPGQKIVGFATKTVSANTEVAIQTGGEITASLAASQTIVAGDSLKTTADGRLVKCVFNSSTDWAVAIALEAVTTTANPAPIKVLITPTAAATVTA